VWPCDNIRDWHARTTNEQFLAFSPSYFSGSILTSSPWLSCHSGSATDEIWRHINFSRWRSRFSRFLIYWCPCPQKVKIYQQTKFRRHISIYGWDITTSCLEKQTSALLEFYFRFRSRPFPRNLHFILHHPAEFRPNRSSHCGNITSYRFIKRPLNTVSGFAFDIAAFRRSKSISKPNFVDIYQFMANICVWCLENQASAILEFYFRFRSWPFRRNLHAILHKPAEFRPNRSTHCGNMTSYLFFNTTAAATQYYFRFHICWCHCLQKVKLYQCTKFRHISIRGWEFTSDSVKQTSSILEYHFRFRSRSFCSNGNVILYQADEFRPNLSSHCENMASYQFFKIAAAAAYYYFRFRICWCHGLQKVKIYQYTKFRQHSRLKYYHFRFVKTNVRHIGILLPVSISTTSA